MTEIFNIIFFSLEKISLILIIGYLLTRSNLFINFYFINHKQAKTYILISFIFGLLSIYGTIRGINIGGAVINMRDTGPIIAGFIGGPIMGLIAGLIGGIHRLVLGYIDPAIYMNSAYACSISTLILGVLAGLFKTLRDKKNKEISLPLVLIFAVIGEALHLVLVIFVNVTVLSSADYWKSVVDVSAPLFLQKFMLPMVIANAMGVLIFFYFLKNLIKEIATKRNEEKYYKEIQEKNLILEQMNAEITLQKDKEEKLRKIFQLYVPPQDLSSILDQDNLKPGGKIEYKTVLFSDIRGFTKMSEKLTPNDIVHFLNHYFEEMTKCIFNNRGIIDKFIGDAIMARFDNAEDAVTAAIQMVKCLKQINKSEQKALFLKNIPDINIGVGIANGEVIIGNIGSSTRMDFTVIGDIVNVASRLESATKMTEAKILVTDYVYNNIDKTKFKLGNRKALKVRGKENALIVYEIFV